ncbi:hypothetical protein [Butyrivibrio fibrisolvens]|uniref:hypothetical protein n=1 Tax=Butyrivibrio fibrisolvens TaxID=831 RepID=UPI0003B54C5C|nr:hypothetical protein [Butyrivibrio fibrisolvens]
MGQDSSKTLFKTIGYILLILQLIICIVVGIRKQGFHEDEYYSYYSSNRTAGLFVTDRQWQDTDTIKDEFVVIPGQGFNYGLVSTVQSWDVHPPLYYDILHTACSIVPRLFSKWIGIVVNMIAFVIAWLLLSKLMDILRVSDITKLLVLAIWGFNPMTVSFVMFTRMYMWMNVFVIGCALLHIMLLRAARAVENTILLSDSKSMLVFWLRYVLPVMVCSYLGFLTHYYYLIFFVFMGICFTIWLLFRRSGRGNRFSKKLIEAVIYVCSCAVSLGLAVVTYPSAAAHIFAGYRGTEAISEFQDIANFPSRLLFYTGLMNNGVFAGSFVIIAVLLLVGFIVLKIRVSSEYMMLVITGVVYFMVVAKTGLLLGDTSNRYEMPVYWLFVLVIITALELLLGELAARIETGKLFSLNIKEKMDMISRGILYVFCAFLILWGLGCDISGSNILFLYQEEGAKVQYARDNKDACVIVMYNSATPDKVWWITNELMEYPRVYFVSQENDEAITDEAICSSNKLIVYAADDDNKEKMLNMIVDSCDNLGSYEEVGHEENWTTYEIVGKGESAH